MYCIYIFLYLVTVNEYVQMQNIHHVKVDVGAYVPDEFSSAYGPDSSTIDGLTVKILMAIVAFEA